MRAEEEDKEAKDSSPCTRRQSNIAIELTIVPPDPLNHPVVTFAGGL